MSEARPTEPPEDIELGPASGRTDRCVACGGGMLPGARKCKRCKAWQPDVASTRAPAEPKVPRAPFVVTMAVGTVMAVLVSARESPVGDAPPLTKLAADPLTSLAAPAPNAIGPEPETVVPPPPGELPHYTTREIPIGDAHPLDVVFGAKGESLYVSFDDASLREYRIKTGEVVHKTTLPAQGDRIRLLFDRYVAILRHSDAARIPVMDITAWDRDPILLDVGRGPRDIVELTDGRTVVAATTDSKRVSRFDLPTGTRLADIVLPHATGQLFLLRAEGRPYIAAMGALSHAGRPAGAWLDLFDPHEASFGATRRSISVGREPRSGAVSADATAIFFSDRLSNTATFLRVAAATEAKVVSVAQSPEAAFLMNEDRHGLTLHNKARTVTVVDLAKMRVTENLAVDGGPTSGAVTGDRKTLFVTLGGPDYPRRGSGVAVIAGDPPRVVESLPTGEGASAVAVTKDGMHAAIVNYYDRSITLLDRRASSPALPPAESVEGHRGAAATRRAQP